MQIERSRPDIDGFARLIGKRQRKFLLAILNVPSGVDTVAVRSLPAGTVATVLPVFETLSAGFEPQAVINMAAVNRPISAYKVAFMIFSFSC
jgi:hypothetical protein